MTDDRTGTSGAADAEGTGSRDDVARPEGGGSPSALAAVPTGGLAEQLARVEERLRFYESFDRLIQENIARSGELMREAVDLRERSQAEFARQRAEAEERAAQERERQRSLFSGLLDELGAVQHATERLARRVTEALESVEAELPAGGRAEVRLPGSARVADLAPMATPEALPSETAGPPRGGSGFHPQTGGVRETGVGEMAVPSHPHAGSSGSATSTADPAGGAALRAGDAGPDANADVASLAPGDTGMGAEPSQAETGGLRLGDGAATAAPVGDAVVAAEAELAAAEDRLIAEAPGEVPAPSGDAGPANTGIDEGVGEGDAADDAPMVVEAEVGGEPEAEPSEAAGIDDGFVLPDADGVDAVSGGFVAPGLDATGYGTSAPGSVASTPGTTAPSWDAAPATSEGGPGSQEDATADGDDDRFTVGGGGAEPVRPAAAASSDFYAGTLAAYGATGAAIADADAAAGDAAPETDDPGAGNVEAVSPTSGASADVAVVEPRAVTVLVHGVPRAAIALSLQRHLAGLGHVDAVEAREYAEGVLRLQVTTGRGLTLEDLRAWDGGADLESVHLAADVLEVKLPGAEGF